MRLCSLQRRIGWHQVLPKTRFVVLLFCSSISKSSLSCLFSFLFTLALSQFLMWCVYFAVILCCWLEVLFPHFLLSLSHISFYAPFFSCETHILFFHKTSTGFGQRHCLSFLVLFCPLSEPKSVWVFCEVLVTESLCFFTALCVGSQCLFSVTYVTFYYTPCRWTILGTFLLCQTVHSRVVPYSSLSEIGSCWLTWCHSVLKLVFFHLLKEGAWHNVYFLTKHAHLNRGIVRFISSVPHKPFFSNQTTLYLLKQIFSSR